MTRFLPVLFTYFFKRFSGSILAVFGLVSALVFVLDLIELTRIANDASTNALITAAELALMRTPSVSEQVLPFAGLFGGLFGFLALAKSRELVVARAAGTSVWQFIAPALIASLLWGSLGTLALNPLSATLKAHADAIMAHTDQNSSQSKKKEIWLRQKSVDGEAILRAETADLASGDFKGITAFEFDKSGRFIHRVVAQKGHLDDGVWILTDAKLLSPGSPPENHDTYELSTFLTKEQVRQSLSAPDTISVYALPGWARATEAAGLDATHYRQQFQSLMARPALLAAMILIAATVSLRFSRTGVSIGSILGGVAGGFALYVANKISGDFGANGLLNPIFASFIAPVLSGLICTLILLYLEDG